MKRRVAQLRAILLGLVLSTGPAQAQTALSVLATPGGALDAEPGDPITLRRVLSSAEQLPQLLERARQGTLLKMSRDEFESKVRDAAFATQAARQPSRLLRASYRAVLEGDALAGSGEWIVQNSWRDMLALADFNLGVSHATLDQAPAILGEKRPGVQGLILEKPGQHAFKFDWTARGEAGADGRRFELRTPPCLLTSMELIAPSGVIVSVSSPQEACFLSAPRAGPAAGQRKWCLECKGAGRLDILIHRDSGLEPPAPSIFARLDTRAVLEAGLAEIDFEIVLNVAQRGLHRLVCSCDPGVRPLSVTQDSVELSTWEWQPGVTSEKPSELTLLFAEPFLGGPRTLKVHALAPVVIGKEWSVPGLRIRNAIELGETISLSLPPNLSMGSWQPGNFRLVKATTEPSGQQVLRLRSRVTETKRDSGNPAHQSGRGRPHGCLQALETGVRAREISWWRIGLQGESLWANFHCEVSNGQLFRPVFRLPDGWQVRHVEVTPNGLLRDWDITRSSKGETQLIVDLQQGLGSQSSFQVSLELVPNKPRFALPPGNDLAAETIKLPFPHVTLEPAHSLQEVLGISVDPAYRASVEASVPQMTGELGPVVDAQGDRPMLAEVRASVGSSPGPEPPWGGQTPQRLYEARNGPVQGTVSLSANPSRLKVRCETEVVAALGQAALTIRLHVEPTSGSANQICYSSSVEISGWRWTSSDPANPVSVVERPAVTQAMLPLLTLGSSSPFQHADILARLEISDPCWRITMARPMRGPLTLESHVDLQGQKALLGLGVSAGLVGLGVTPQALSTGLAALGQFVQPGTSWEVPLILVHNADAADPEVRIRLTGNDLVQEHYSGLEATDPIVQSAAGPFWRVYRYGKRHASLSVQVRPPSGEGRAEILADQAQLSSYVTPDQRIIHHFAFRIRRWNQLALPVWLPSRQMQVLGVRLDGTWLQLPLPTQTTDEGSLLSLPGASGNGPHQFELFYAQDLPAWLVYTSLRRAIPTLPVQVPGVRRVWLVPAGLSPVRQDLYRPHSAPRQMEDERNSGELLRGELPVELAAILEGAKEIGKEIGANSGGFDPVAGEEGKLPWDQTLYRLSSTGNWTAWEARGNGEGETPFLLVRNETIRGVAAALTFMVLIALWPSGQATNLRRWLLCAVFVGGLSLVWIPAGLRVLVIGPLAAIMFICCRAYVGWILRRAFRSMSTAPGATVAAIAVAIGSLALRASAAPPPPQVVWLVPRVTDPTKYDVLVEPELIARLKRLTQNPTAALPDCLLVSARYSGRIEGSSCSFDADYELYCSTEGPSSVAVPLSEIELREALLDGRAAFPVLTAPPRKGLLVKASGRGMHRLHLRFMVPINRDEKEPLIKFPIPELLQSELRLTAPRECRYLRAFPAAGRQQILNKSSETVLEADLGRAQVLQLRWLQGGNAGSPRLAVREAYFWDLRPASERLFACLQYRVNQGAATRLSIDLPNGMAVRRLDTDSYPAGETSPRLQNWTISEQGKNRVLDLEFASPITKGVQVFVELLPCAPLGTSALLAVPGPRGAASQEGLIAYCGEERPATAVEYRGVTVIPTENFVRNWRGAGVDDPGPPERCYSFRRTSGADPYLRLEFPTPEVSVQGSQRILWHIGPKQADLQALIAARAKGGADLALLEWSLPEVLRITDVSGPQVRSWSRTKTGVQVWLRRSVEETNVRLFGELDYSSKESSSALDLPEIRCTSLPGADTQVHVDADTRLRLYPVELTNLVPLPQPKEAGSGQDFQVQKAPYRARFRIERRPADAERPVGQKDAGHGGTRRIGMAQLVHHGPPEIFLEDITASMPNGRQWSYQADYLLRASTGTDLHIAMQEGAWLAGAALDGQEARPVPVATARYWLPLPSTQEAHRLQLAWKYKDSEGPTSLPRLVKPIIQDAVYSAEGGQRATLWSVQLPLGVGAYSTDATVLPCSMAEQDLERASAHLALSSALIAGNRNGAALEGFLLANQEQFRQLCRRVQHELSLRTSSPDAPTQHHALVQRLAQLRLADEEFLSAAGLTNRESAPGYSNRQPTSEVGHGIDTYGSQTLRLTRWLLPAEQQDLHLRIAPMGDQTVMRKALLSFFLIALLWLALMISYVPRIVGILPLLWPETLLLAGFLTWILFGPNAIALLLIGAGLLARLLTIIAWTVAGIRRLTVKGAA
jgi:hypothetical protein